MGLFAVAGSRIYIGRRVAVRDDLSLLDFSAAPWLEIKGWATAGQIGDTQEVVSQGTIGGERTRKGKGTRNSGRMDNSFVPLPNDPGQQRFRAAIESCSAYEFKVEWNAGCAEADNTAPSTDYFHGLAYPGAKQGGEANAAQMRMWSIEIASNIVEDDGSTPALALLSPIDSRVLLSPIDGRILLRAA